MLHGHNSAEIFLPWPMNSGTSTLQHKAIIEWICLMRNCSTICHNPSCKCSPKLKGAVWFTTSSTIDQQQLCLALNDGSSTPQHLDTVSSNNWSLQLDNACPCKLWVSKRIQYYGAGWARKFPKSSKLIFWVVYCNHSHFESGCQCLVLNVLYSPLCCACTVQP